MIVALFSDLRRQGVTFRLNGDQVCWRAPAGTLGSTELDALRRNRDALRDILDAFEERAAIREYEGGQTRAAAEAGAWVDLTDG